MLCEVLVVPSPKSQTRSETVPVEVSVNVTSSGATPEVGVAVKLETGAAVVELVEVVELVPATVWLTSLEKPLSFFAPSYALTAK